MMMMIVVVKHKYEVACAMSNCVVPAIIKAFLWRYILYYLWCNYKSKEVVSVPWEVMHSFSVWGYDGTAYQISLK